MQRYSTLFWDFDGVIKESVDVKTEAYVRLFEPFGRALAQRVREHHELNGGTSRFRKIPLYLAWAGVDPTEEEVERYCRAFSAAVRQGVIDSPWVPGVRDYLAANWDKQRFILLTATPQGEMEDILSTVAISDCFTEVHGAPTEKRDAIVSVLSRLGCERGHALLIGDSRSDHEAAQAAGIDFLLRRTTLNQTLQRSYLGPQCEDFILHG